VVCRLKGSVLAVCSQPSNNDFFGHCTDLKKHNHQRLVSYPLKAETMIGSAAGIQTRFIYCDK
jgi:hypothetical protein